MTLVSEQLAPDTLLYKGFCIYSGRGPKETFTEGLTHEGLSCGMVATETSMYFSQELPPLLFGDAPLKDSGCTFLIKLSLMDLVGFRSPHYAASLILVLG